MDLIARFLFLASFSVVFSLVKADTYSVKVSTEHHVNVVDNRFLSFTVDPKYLFAGSEKYDSKESTCMATALSPAFIRIAGPSTEHMTFNNYTISFTDLDASRTGKLKPNQKPSLSVTHSQWKRFIKWAKDADFHLVFALNGQEKTQGGLWDPNGAIDILTVADQANVSDIYWQLGYECQNQTIEEYLNDLETLRVITETFPLRVTGAGEDGNAWRVVGGDVTPCLRARTKSDFKDYVVLTEDMMDAIMLNGNSSAQELEKMSDSNRIKLLQLLSISKKPLWITETTKDVAYNSKDVDKNMKSSKRSEKSYLEKAVELKRAADWMSSLGYSARNGFSVHFRELIEEEIYEPTLSFYMALLFKNLVGSRVLDVTMESDKAVLFAHCTSLRRKSIPGAVTLYGANMDDEPARMAVKLSKKEEGGDIMQFILGLDNNGNIIVNGRAMYYEGDIRPVVKRVRPYKTLLLNLPPKSFGFWVLANTKITACHDVDEEEDKEFVEAVEIGDDSNIIQDKQLVIKENSHDTRDKNYSGETFDGTEKKVDKIKQLKDRVKNMNSGLKRVNRLFAKEIEERKPSERVRRQIQYQDGDRDSKRKLLKQSIKSRIYKNRLADDDKTPLHFIRKLMNQIPKLNGTKHLRHEKSKKLLRLSRNKVSKRNSNDFKAGENLMQEAITENTVLKRKRRSVIDKKQDNYDQTSSKIIEADSMENEIDSTEQAKLWKILRRIHQQIQHLPENKEHEEKTEEEEHILVRTKFDEDGATIKYKDSLVKSTIGNVMSVLKDLNKNLNKVWGALSIMQ